MIINFISKEEKINSFSNGQITSSRTLNFDGKIIRITYMNLSRERFDRYDRKAHIFVEFFVAGNSPEFLLKPFYIKYRYHARNFKFETMVPTTVPNLLNFRYQDENGFCYFTVVNKETNRICEAGFYDKMEMMSLGKTDIIVDYPNRNISQELLFDRSPDYFEEQNNG